MTSRSTAYHHCLTVTITNLTPGTQPRQVPDSPTRQPGNPATRQHPAAPGSTRQHLEVPAHPHSLAAPGTYPAAPGSTRHRPGTPAPPRHHPGTTPAPPRHHPGNPATRPGNTRQPGNKLLVEYQHGADQNNPDVTRTPSLSSPRRGSKIPIMSETMPSHVYLYQARQGLGKG